MAEEQKTNPEEGSQSIVDRVSQYKAPETPASEVSAEQPFNVTDIDKIADPDAKEYANKAYKSFQSDYTRKTQELAEQRKTLDTKLAEYSNWTPQRIQTLLNDPEFVKAAQSVAGNQQQTSADDSMMTDNEKKRMEQIDSQIKMVLQQNQQLLKTQQDTTLKEQFSNYNPQAVDTLTADLLANKVQATRKDLWKVIDYEPAIQRAYELGKQDRKLEMGEKVQATSFEGQQVTTEEDKPKPEEGEKGDAWFKRILLHNMTEQANK